MFCPSKEIGGRTPERPFQYHILVVDDNELNRYGLVVLLESLGQTEHVEQAADGEEALRLFSSRHLDGMAPYDVVFMDINMPVMHGDDATLALRKVEVSENRRYTHVIGLSAYCMDDTKDLCLRKGMDGYETKPMTLATLRRVIGEFAMRISPSVQEAGEPSVREPLVQRVRSLVEAQARAPERELNSI